MAPRGSPAAMAPHGPLLRLGASLAVCRSVVDGKQGEGWRGEGRGGPASLPWPGSAR